MPEKTSFTYREKSYTLADADRNGQIIEAHCKWCHVTCHFRPADMIAVLGNQKTYSIADYITCQTCRKKDYMLARPRSYAGSEIGTLQVRELVEVYYVKKSRWKNGVL